MKYKALDRVESVFLASMLCLWNMEGVMKGWDECWCESIAKLSNPCDENTSEKLPTI